MVARLGASIPAPFAMPPTVQPSRCCTVVLGTESVVMIARAASAPPSSESAFTAAVTPAVSLSRGSRTPISPVLATATSMAPMPSSFAACSAVAWVSWKPSGPVQALAPPELRTTARARSPASTWRLQSTGAAGKRLVVKTAAAASSGPWLRTTATSGSPLDLSPAATPAAEKPAGAVTLTCPPRWRSSAAFAALLCPCVNSQARSRCDSYEREDGGLGKPEGEVGALQRRSPGPLGQIVDRGDDDQAAGVLVDGELQGDGVGAEHLRRRRPLPLGEHMDERLVGVEGLVGVPGDLGVLAGRELRRTGGEDAPAHGDERRGEADGHRRTGRLRQVLHHLRRVPVH